LVEEEMLRTEVAKFLSGKGVAACLGVEHDQPFHLGLFSGLLSALGDVDAGLPAVLKEGVSTGVFTPVESSGVWRQRAEGQVHEEELEACDCNWTSAEQDPELVRSLLQADLDAGFLEVWPGTLADARARWPQGIAVGKLAVIKAPGQEPRLVGDSTICGANPKSVIRERVECPSITEVERAMCKPGGPLPTGSLCDRCESGTQAREAP
jgi:hypothetical protein